MRRHAARFFVAEGAVAVPRSAVVALGCRSRVVASGTLKVAVAASLTVHAALAMALSVDWPRTMREPKEADAKIELIFGHNATANGAPAAAATASPSRSAAAAPQDAGDSSPHSGATQPAGSGSAQASLPVRLGDGVVGFEVPEVDAGIVEAQSDPGNRPPPYPADAYRRHEQGSVGLRIHIGTDGKVTQIETLESSGYSDLDRAARDAAMRWRFIPQLRDGEAVPSVRDQRFDFILD